MSEKQQDFYLNGLRAAAQKIYSLVESRKAQLCKQRLRDFPDEVTYTTCTGTLADRQAIVLPADDNLVSKAGGALEKLVNGSGVEIMDAHKRKFVCLQFSSEDLTIDLGLHWFLVSSYTQQLVKACGIEPAHFYGGQRWVRGVIHAVPPPPPPQPAVAPTALQAKEKVTAAAASASSKVTVEDVHDTDDASDVKEKAATRERLRRVSSGAGYPTHRVEKETVNIPAATTTTTQTSGKRKHSDSDSTTAHNSGSDSDES